MKSWFKARMTWGAGIDALSDAEAGRFAKALWKYAATHEEIQLQGAEKVLLALALMELRQDDIADAELANARANAGRMGGLQKQANLANASTAKQNVANLANATNKNKNKEEDINNNTNRARVETPFGIVEVDELQNYAQQELTGLTSTHLEELSQYGDMMPKDLVMHAIDEAVANGVRNWAYVRAILQGYLKANIKTVAQAKQVHDSRKKTTTPQGKQVTAQMYNQREYTEEELEARTNDLLKEAMGL